MEDLNMFEEVKTYKDVKNIIEENIITLYHEISNQKLLELGLKIILKPTNRQERRLVAIAHLLDKIYIDKNNLTNNKEKKIPVLLISILYLDRFYEEVKLLTNTELILLSDYVSNKDLKSMDFYRKLFGRKLLNYVHHKTTNYEKKEKLLRLIDNKYVKDYDINKFNEEMIEYVIKITEQEFNKEYKKLEAEEVWI